MSRRRLTLARHRAGALWLCASAIACTRESTGRPSFVAAHCIDYGGDEACLASQAGRPYCDLCQPATEYQGCAALRPRLPVCDPHANDDVTTDASSTTDAVEGSETTSTGTSSSESSEASAFRCEGQPGELAEDCLAIDDTRPYCEAGVCLGCGEIVRTSFCAEIDEERPSCDVAAGHCVACDEVSEGCGLAAPVCNTSTGACTACTSHADCPSSACHLDPGDPRFGGCFAPEQVRVVDNQAAVCPGLGSEASPHCTIDEALAGITDEGAEAVLQIRGGGPAHAVGVVIDRDVAIALLGIDRPVLTGEAGQAGAVLRVEAGFVYAADLTVADHTRGAGLECDGATLWLQRSELRGNADYGLYTTAPCEVVVENSVIHHNTGGGLRQFGGHLRLHTSAIGLNGNGVRGPGLNLALTTVDVRYATIVANVATGAADNVGCLDAAGIVRNSLVLGTTTSSIENDCSSITWNDNVVDTLGFAGPGGTVNQQPFNAVWFQNPAAGDLRLGAPGLTPFLGGVALWQAGDPRVDIDGTPRPTDGTRGFVGIDEP